MSIRVLLSLSLCSSSIAVWAAEPPAKADSVPAAAPATPAAGAKAEQFAKVSKEFSELIASLTEMQAKYAASGSTAAKAELKAKFDADRKKAAALADQVVAAATEAYKEAPNADLKVTEVLLGTLVDQIQRDDYEPAYAIGKMLMDNNCPVKLAPALAGIAAYCVNDYDAAEPWLKAAEASKALAEVCDGIRKGQSDNALYYQSFPYSIAQAKAEWAKEKKIRDAEAKADDLPRVVLKTSKGDIVIELLENEAPNTVLNFITLVEKGFYDGVPFHRVLPGFMAQGGDPKGTGSGGPGYTIPDECNQPNYRHHFRGSLSMAHAGPNTGGSQFFLTFLPTPHLDGKHTVFGRVIDGFDVLAKLKRINPENSTAASADKIVEAKVLRKRSHPYDAKDVKKSGTRD
jgi:cyclophilin family peptidyl-prolyl cis-trans isomerase